MRDFPKLSDPLFNSNFTRNWAEPGSPEAEAIALRERVARIHAAGPDAVAGLILELAGLLGNDAGPIISRHAAQPQQEVA